MPESQPEASDYSSLASILVIDAAVKACGAKDLLYDIVLNVAAICEKTNKSALKRFFGQLKRQQGKAHCLGSILGTSGNRLPD